MTDTSTADELPPQTNGVVDNNGLLDDEERARMRPADIDADVREMERRKRVEMIMNSKLFREVIIGFVMPFFVQCLFMYLKASLHIVYFCRNWNES